MYLRVETAPPPLLQLRKQHRVFGWWAGVQAGLFSRTEAARQLQPAITKPSDDGGLYCIANEGSTASGCVQAFSGRGVEWYSVATVAASAPGPGFGTITTSAYCSADVDAPNLHVQVVPSGPEALLLYIALQPRVDVAADHSYLQRYYEAPPPQPAPAAADVAAAADGADVAAPLPSWHQLQATAWALPGWAHYRSRGLEMNVMGAGLDIFGTLPTTDDSLQAVECLCYQALDIWMAFLAAAEAAASSPTPGAGQGPAPPAAAAAVEVRRRRDAAVRQLLLHDPDTAMAERLFGREPMQTLLKVASRHADVRLP